MNTDPKNINSDRAPSHPEQLNTDVNTQPERGGASLPFPTNEISLGDCTQLLRRLPAESIDLIITDPPYLVHYKDRTGRQILNDGNSRWLFPAFYELFRVLKPDSYCVCFYGWSKVDKFISAWRECGFRPVGHIVWAKDYSSLTRHVKMKHEQAYLLAKGEPPLPSSPPDDVLPWKYTGNHLHPTQKPVNSLIPLINAYSKPRDLVLDPFAGSGTTGIAARLCGRRFVLIEKDPAFYNTAKERLG